MRNGSHRYKLIGLLSLVLFVAGTAGKAFGQATAFTYQGRLQDAGTNANGNYDFQFTLWDSLNGGTQQPQPSPATVTKSGVGVVNGVFTVQLDFGSSAFPGADRFLEIGARSAGGGAFTILIPRQQITSTPYAIRSASASNADLAVTATNATQLGGVAAANYLQIVAKGFSLTGNGTSGSPLNVAVPLQLSGSLVGQGIILATNTHPAGIGVFGDNNGNGSGIGVYGNNNGNGYGVYGQNIGTGQGLGVEGYSDNGIGILGSSLNGFGGYFIGRSYFNDNVGIGTRTPGSNLEVVQSVQGPGRVATVAGGTTLTGASTQFTNTFQVGDTIQVLGEANLTITAIGSDTSLTVNAAFSTTASGRVYALVGGTRLAVKGNGNVGIGTANPQSRLHVAGNTFLAGNVGIGPNPPPISGRLSVDGDTKLNGNAYVSATTSVVELGSGAGTGSEIKFVNLISPFFSIYNSPGSGRLTIADTSNAFDLGAAGTPLVSFMSNGNVGIGTTAPAARLHVVGSTALGGVLTVSGDATLSGNVGVGTTNSNARFQIDNGGNSIYAHSTNGFGIWARSESTDAGYFEGSTHFTRWITLDELMSGGSGNPLCRNSSNQISNCSSSLRYKKDVHTFAGGLKLINRLRPISFTWKDGGKSDLGLAAEEVEKVEPLLTFRNDKGEIEGVKYDRINVVLINAIKEQQAQIQAQKEQLERERALNAAHQEQLNSLKNLVCRSHRRARVCR